MREHCGGIAEGVRRAGERGLRESGTAGVGSAFADSGGEALAREAADAGKLYHSTRSFSSVFYHCLRMPFRR